MITVSNLSKAYGGTTVVDNLDFEVQPGIVTGFLGPNGAGKSTTMRMMVGLDQPTNGHALIDGKPYAAYDKPLHKVGTLLDAKWVHPKRSARAHLEWIAASNRISTKRVDEVLGIVGLTDVAKRKAGNYSLGMGQRLGLAAAMLGDPEILILDEPVNGLDPEGIRWVRDFVRALAAEGRTVLVSSHLLSEMSLTADHLIVIGKGKLVANTSTHEFIKSASEVATVVRADNLSALQNALTTQGVEFSEQQDADHRPTIRIPGRTSDEIGEIAFTTGVKVYELTEVRPSLEDAFMRMTGDSLEYAAAASTTVGSSTAADAANGAMVGSGANTQARSSAMSGVSAKSKGRHRGNDTSVSAAELLKRNSKPQAQPQEGKDA